MCVYRSWLTALVLNVRSDRRIQQQERWQRLVAFLHDGAARTWACGRPKFDVLYICYIHICECDMPGRSAVRGASLRTLPRRHVHLCPCQPSCFQLLVGSTTNECGFPPSTRSCFNVRASWLPDDFDGGGGTTVPLSGGLVGLYRCGAMRRNAPSPWAHKHKTTPGTSLSTSESNRRTAQPARRQKGQAASENFCGHTTLTILLCARTLSLA